MTFGPVRLDHAGIGEIMRSSEVRAVVVQASEAVAAAARMSGRPVEVLIQPAVPGGGISDGRPVGRVTILHPSGLGLEAKRGVLSRAAAAEGLEVTGR